MGIQFNNYAPKKFITIMSSLKDVRLVVVRLFTAAAGGPVNTTKKIQSKFSNTIKQIEATYGVKLPNCETLSIDEVVDICYRTCREKALKKIKGYIEEYEFDVKELFSQQ